MRWRIRTRVAVFYQNGTPGGQTPHLTKASDGCEDVYVSYPVRNDGFEGYYKDNGKYVPGAAGEVYVYTNQSNMPVLYDLASGTSFYVQTEDQANDGIQVDY
jgi:hypothetical protein